MTQRRNPFQQFSKRNRVILAAVLGSVLFFSTLFVINVRLEAQRPQPKFEIVEASIRDIHNAIRTKQLTCKQVVQAYVERAKAYNGVCTQLVTKDGAPVAPATGRVSAGVTQKFPTTTFPVSNLLPNLDQYVGLPIELGRMETTISDPGVQAQFGIVTGVHNAGQINALQTINIRGERSVTCKGAFDAHPSTGPLPGGAPPGCEKFRQQPDALERAAELDAQYGSNPPLDKLPMYCVVLDIKDWYETKDMRSTGGYDVNFALDVPPDDSTIAAELRAKGGIIYSISTAAHLSNTEAGPATPTKRYLSTRTARNTWGGSVCNPYDTERYTGHSSGGSAAAVSANLVTCSICETTGGSCRIPGTTNGVASLVTTKGVISSDSAINATYINNRPGVLCRTIGDAARVLDALKDPQRGYFDPKDMFTALPKALIPKGPYAKFLVDDKDLKAKKKALEGMRIGIVREFMIKPNPNDVAITDQIDKEIKTVLRDKLGAELVESVDPLYPDDPDVPNMKYTFQNAFAEIMALNVPEYFFQMSGGALEFAVPGWDVRTKDYALALALGKAPLSPNLNLRRITNGLDNIKFTPFLTELYLRERGDSRVHDWASWVANAKFFADEIRAGSENAAKSNVQDLRATSGISHQKMVNVARLVLLKVMYENHIDVLVNPALPLPAVKIGFARDPTTNGLTATGSAITDLLGVPEFTVPAGFNQVVYETQYALNAAKNNYNEVPGTVKSSLPHPLPFSMMFWAGPGDEPTVLKVASAYEAATHHRKPPPDFGPVNKLKVSN